jgi:hypothetical protein
VPKANGSLACFECCIPPSSDVRTLSISPCIKDVDASSRSLLIKSTTLQTAAGEMSDRSFSMLARKLAGTIRTPTESYRTRPLFGRAAKGEAEAERGKNSASAWGWEIVAHTHLREQRVRISLTLSISDTISLVEMWYPGKSGKLDPLTCIDYRQQRRHPPTGLFQMVGRKKSMRLKAGGGTSHGGSHGEGGPSDLVQTSSAPHSRVVLLSMHTPTTCGTSALRDPCS